MHKILVVDDDKITHSFIKRALAYKYDIINALSGEQALAELELNHPDVILLDVEMPGMNGYVVCEIIKANPKLSDIPIIFLSARAELRDRLQGFEAGADDYIIKPFHTDELLAKIDILIQYHIQRQELTEQVNEARKTAFIAISSTSDLGQAINFIEKTHRINNFDQLSDAFFTVTRYMDLKCTIMIRAQDEILYFSSTYNTVSPMEAELIANLANESRFYDFGNRTQINFPRISLLIKNMPLDDMERYGRIKDFFPAMLTTADIKISQICSQSAVIDQMRENREAFGLIASLLNHIKTKLNANQKQGVKIMRAMLMELDRNLPAMALIDTQEQYILDRIDHAIEEAHKTISDNQIVNTAFHGVLENLATLLSKQQNLENLFLIPDDEDIKHDDDEGYQMDVELF